MNSALARQRLARLKSLASPCRLCPRNCGADRLSGETGFCGAGAEAFLFLEYVHWGEDADISPAHTLYLTGCNLACRFCQTAEESRTLPARRLTPELFRAVLESGRRQGALFVDLLGGEPTVNLPALLKLFSETGDFPNLVWNTNLYASAEAFELLNGLADVFMGDLKFGDPACAAALAGAGDAVEIARARALEIYSRRPDSLIVRHLVLPGHFDCCARPTLEWIARRLPGARVSLRTGYLPPRSLSADCGEKRFLTPEEAAAARGLAENLGLRLTGESVRPPAPAPGPQAGGPRPVEAVIAPDGRVFLRHLVREAALAAGRLEAPSL